MSCSLCWQLMQASAAMDGSTGVEPADQSCLGRIYQCGDNREIPRFRPTSLDIYGPITSRPAFDNFRGYAATAPRAARGRGNAGEALGYTVAASCNDQACSACFEDYPPISYPTICMFCVKERNQAVGQPPTLLAGAFWPRRPMHIW
jgi:hypothetical protein